MKLFHWGLLLRYMVYGVLPLVAALIVLERHAGPEQVSLLLLFVALALPFLALGWLAYQHYRHHKNK